MSEINYDFASFKDVYIKEVQAEGGNVTVAENGDFTITIPIVDYPTGQMIWEKGNIYQKYEDFLSFVKQQEDIDFAL